MAEEQRKLMRDPEELEKDALKDKNPFLSTMYIKNMPDNKYFTKFV